MLATQRHQHPHMPPVTPPSLDLPLIVAASSAERVPAIPLKPSRRIHWLDPPLALPLAVAHPRAHLEAIQRSVIFRLRQQLLDPLAPIRRKLQPALRATREI